MQKRTQIVEIRNYFSQNRAGEGSAKRALPALCRCARCAHAGLSQACPGWGWCYCKDRLGALQAHAPFRAVHRLRLCRNFKGVLSGD